MDEIEKLKISHEDTHKLNWELHKRTQEVMELQNALHDFQSTILNERKHALHIVAENDKLKSFDSLYS
jgi:hypothetical protein